MEAFVSRVVQAMGPEALIKLEQVRINRGPLISKTPARDFLNQAKGDLYSHKRIRGTDYYILTHSETSQKVDDLKKVCRVLGFAPESVHIEQVNRHAWLDKFEL